MTNPDTSRETVKRRERRREIMEAMEDETDGFAAGSLAVDFVLDVLSEALGDPAWIVCDGSETWDGDVAGTVYSLLHAAGVIDEDTGETAMQRADALLARAEAAEAERDALYAKLHRAHAERDAAIAQSHAAGFRAGWTAAAEAACCPYGCEARAANNSGGGVPCAALPHPPAQEPPQSSGFIIVPAEPTRGMEDACLRAAIEYMREQGATEIWPDRPTPDPRENVRRCYRAMLAAAQQEPQHVRP
jgi:hypothetical protein